MSKGEKQKQKTELHPRNKNRESYNLQQMIVAKPALKEFIIKNKRGDDSINFSDPEAVKMLNKAILGFYYGINFWEFPDENLCPPIPGRADYIHYVADLLSESNDGNIPIGKKITCLDIGTGASCIYPILGVKEYQWNFIAADTNNKALKSAKKIVDLNPSLKGKVELRQQKNPTNFFKGIIQKEEKIDITICNPPFHASAAEAAKGTMRKLRNLKLKKESSVERNFSGKHNELVYPGGEYGFIAKMINESQYYEKNCLWFSSLVSKQTNEKKLLKLLEKSTVSEVKSIATKTGNKSSRILAWTYLSKQERTSWY